MSDHEHLCCVLVGDMLRRKGFTTIVTPAAVDIVLRTTTVTITFKQIDELAHAAVDLADETDGSIQLGVAFAAQIHIIAQALAEVDADPQHAIRGGDS